MTFSISKIRELCDAATEGPWEWREETEPLHMRTLSPGVLVLDNDPGCGGPWGDNIDRANAAFIAHARTALPQALDEIERLTRERDEAVGLLRTAIRNALTKDEYKSARAFLARQGGE